MLKRVISAGLLSLALILASCGGGSEDSQQPAPSLSESSALSEEDAVAQAKTAAVEQGYSTDDLRVNPALIFGEWHVSFEPTSGDSLVGGYLVVLDAESGELLDLIEYI